MSTEDQIKEAAASAKKSLNIVNVLAERAYPRATIKIHLDEQTAYDAAMVKEDIDVLEKKMNGKNGTAAQTKELERLNKKLEDYYEILEKSSYIFHIKGISEGKRDELFTEAKKKYPIEYERPSEIALITGTQTRATEKESPERDNLFTDLLWLEHIEKVEDPDGNTQDSFTYNDIKALRSSLPLSSLAKINSGIEKIRNSTAIFMMETGEDFLAKP